MKTLLTILLLTVTTFAGLPTKLEELRQKRDKAIENINLIYKQELQKLLVDPAIKGDPTQLSYILNELGELEQSYPQHDVNFDKKSLEKLFVQKSFVSMYGAEFVFLKDGVGKRISGKSYTPFIWKILDDNIVFVEGSLSESDNSGKKWYFKFEKNKASFGEDGKVFGVDLKEKK